MSEDQKEETKEETKEKPKMSVQEVFGMYPIDREKARDVISMEISSCLLRIAASMEALPQALLTISQKLDNLLKKE